LSIWLNPSRRKFSTQEYGPIKTKIRECMCFRASGSVGIACRHEINGSQFFVLYTSRRGNNRYAKSQQFTPTPPHLLFHQSVAVSNVRAEISAAQLRGMDVLSSHSLGILLFYRPCHTQRSLTLPAPLGDMLLLRSAKGQCGGAARLMFH